MNVLNPAVRALVEAREFAAEFMRSWSKGTAADGYLAGAYDHTHAVQSLAIRLAPPASDAAASGAGEDTVAFVQEWLMNADYDPTQFDRDFAAAIDARVAAAAPKVASE